MCLERHYVERIGYIFPFNPVFFFSGLGLQLIRSRTVQLGALRLDTDRSFLSLIDGEFQYIVAEATRQQSLLPNKVTEGEPPLFLGVCKLDKGFGVCPNTMRAFTDSNGTWVANGPNVICDRTRYVINDFRADLKYLEKPYVAGYPYMVSYLEVPLVSPLGYVLGSYCVVDNKKREFNNDKTVDTMTEIATAIMCHLDLVKLKEHRARSERLMVGLGQLVDRGCSTANSTVSASVTGSFDNTRCESEVGSMLGTGIGSYGSTMLGSVRQDDLTPVSEPQRRQSTYSQLSLMQMSASEGSIGSSEYPFSMSAGWTPPISPSQMDENDFFESFTATSEAVHMSRKSSGPGDRKMSVEIPTPPSPQERWTSDLSPPKPPLSVTSTATATITHVSPVSLDVRDTLSRAAVTIREAMGMDRVTFFDAVPSGFASRSAHPTPHEDPLSLDASEFFAEETQDVHCATLAQATKSTQGASSTLLQMPEAMLIRLISRFPRGHIFTADSLGPIDCRYGPGHAMRNIQRKKDRTSRYRADIRKLFSLVPDARYIVMLPLWHFQKEVWFSALFGIVENPNFSIDVADMNLITAFAHSTMMEVSRCESLAVSKAKSDFISSISHELR